MSIPILDAEVGSTQQDEELETFPSGHPQPNLDRVTRILDGHSRFKGRFLFDEFTGQVLSTWPNGVPREWRDADDLVLTVHLQRHHGMSRLTVAVVSAAVNVVANGRRENSATKWLESLRWDRRSRLGVLMHRGFGSELNHYTEAVGRCFLVGMVARMCSPGCKVDAMPVFEGPQGIRKSSGLKALAGDRWFAEAAESVTSKDFFTGLQGKACIEISEMDTFSRAEVSAVKRVVTCQVDRYRAPYGRRSEDHPRTCVFAGTTNRKDWNRDETGARRFWPIACTGVDLNWIRANRDQLFAEAVARFREGESWWDVPEDMARLEQHARRERDEWEVPIERYVAGAKETTVAAILEHGLGILPLHWTKPAQMRVAALLGAMGWKRKQLWRGGRSVWGWVLEEEEAASTHGT